MKRVIYLGYRTHAPNLPVGPFDHLDTDPYCADFYISPLYFYLETSKVCWTWSGRRDSNPQKLLAWKARPLALGLLPHIYLNILPVKSIRRLMYAFTYLAYMIAFLFTKISCSIILTRKYI